MFVFMVSFSADPDEQIEYQMSYLSAYDSV